MHYETGAEQEMIQLTDEEFNSLVTFIRSNYGIDLSKKRLLIEARMFSVLSEKKITSFSEYFELLHHNSGELNTLLNKLTTNHTYFMREPRHFEFLKNVILPQQERTNREHNMRIWSAGCSTGEEAYTAVMTMKDYFGENSGWDTRILATDISTKVLEGAQKGVYREESLQNLSPEWKRLYFRKVGDTYVLSEKISREVIFRELNLMDEFHFRNPFDLIFCRNVMIYFNQEAKEKLIRKFSDLLKPGGYLFIGHSESIQWSGVTGLRYIEPSIYQKG
jgi:chemotaxis protein methyltransferase CheR